VYCAGPASQGSGAPRLGLSLGGRQVFNEASSGARDRLLGCYLTDMLAQYGLVLRDDVDIQSSGYFYGEMATSVIPAVLALDGGQRPVDLLIFAFAIADLAPGRSTATYLAHLCPGEPLAFTICDQGIAAPYTALRLLGAYSGSAGCRRALLMVAEQATAFYDLPAPAAMPTTNAAVLLVFDADGHSSLGPIRQVRGVGPAAAYDVVSAAVTELAHRPDDVTLITGNGLDSCGPPPPLACGKHLAAPPGQPCTGAWWELIGGLGSSVTAGRRVLIADYDATLQYVCIAAIDVAARPAPLAVRL
jgi:hypothetical protein